jgi:hypothetical protein
VISIVIRSDWTSRGTYIRSDRSFDARRHTVFNRLKNDARIQLEQAWKLALQKRVRVRDLTNQS